MAPATARADDPVYEPELVRPLIERDCPELAPVRVSRFGRGWDHDVFLVNQAWVFRFPRNAPAADALKVERTLLPWLSQRLPFPIPQPRFHGLLDSERGWAFAGYPLLEGTTVCDARLGPDARAALAPALGAFLRALHALNPDDAPVPLQGETLRRLDVAYRVPQTRERLQQLQENGSLPEAAVAKLLQLSAAPSVSLPGQRAVIVHCDVHSRNVLVDDAGKMSGVIDWVDAHRGERVHDLVAAFEVLPPHARTVFFQHYGEVDPATLRWARWRAVNHTVFALGGAVERGDQAFEVASRQALLEMVEAG